MALLPLFPVVSLLNVPIAIVLREVTTGYDDEGRPVRTYSADIQVTPVVAHPASGESVSRLPDADQTKATIEVFCGRAMKVEDEVDYSGATYRVVQAQDWTQQAGHWRILAQELVT